MSTLTIVSHSPLEEIKNRRDELVEQRLKTVRSWVCDIRKMVEQIAEQVSIQEIGGWRVTNR